jgi:hypothetical protein
MLRGGKIRLKKRDKNRVIETIETEIEDIGKYAGKVPRWSFLIAVLVIGILFSVLSENLTVGPSWFVLAIVSVLLVPLLASVFVGHHRWTRRLAITITSVLTLGLVSSVVFLVYALFKHTETAASLFRDAVLLWSANIMVFAVWYWEVDQGGPIRRHANTPDAPDLLFPQMTSNLECWKDWKPTFIDYVFLAFNTSTAFSPTDTMVMSKRAKVLMMAQASISLVIVAVLAARAINIA